jgi:hypothetical protein
MKGVRRLVTMILGPESRYFPFCIAYYPSEESRQAARQRDMVLCRDFASRLQQSSAWNRIMEVAGRGDAGGPDEIYWVVDKPVANPAARLELSSLGCRRLGRTPTSHESLFRKGCLLGVA